MHLPMSTWLNQELKHALDYAFKSTRNTQGVVIIRHGIIVGERYANEESQR